MSNETILIGTIVEENWLSVVQAAALCQVETQWLVRRMDEGCFPADALLEGGRFPCALLQRAKRMRRLERDFDAVPELAALVADLMEELDELRARHGLPLR